MSSLEVATDLDNHALYAEPFEVSAATALQVNTARAAGRRVIAVGTTVVRALESAFAGSRITAARGFTQTFVRPGHYAGAVDGLLTGFHDPRASHLAMLYAVAGRELVQSAYAEAVGSGYLWHEFGDSHSSLRADLAAAIRLCRYGFLGALELQPSSAARLLSATP